MQQRVLLWVLILIFFAACQKETKNTQPTPPIATSNIPLWLQDIDGYQVEFTTRWKRQLQILGSVEFLLNNNLDTTITSPSPTDNQTNQTISQVYLIQVLRHNYINLNGGYVLTNSTDNNDYYVFCECPDSSQINNILSDTVITNIYNPAQIEQFTKGQINNAQGIKMPSATGFLFIPKQQNLPILSSAIYDYGDYGNHTINWNNPITSNDSAQILTMNNCINITIPYSFYDNYDEYNYSRQDIETYFISGIYK